MASQEQKNIRSQNEEPEVPDLPEVAPVSPQSSVHTEGLDDFLDEIDGVLESNAEEFVRGFIQKGGQ